MNLTIDWVSAGIFIAAYVFSQIRGVPAPARYGVLALACGVIAAYRLRIGAQGFNMLVVLVAGALAVFYLVRAFQSRKR